VDHVETPQPVNVVAFQGVYFPASEGQVAEVTFDESYGFKETKSNFTQAARLVFDSHSNRRGEKLSFSFARSFRAPRNRVA
jgi:hypothetical protein